jgi:hypothetical protein
MRRAALLLVLCAAVAGCATLMARGPDPHSQLVDGVLALDAQDYARGFALLEPLYQERWAEPVGQRAMLALIAVDLDARNPDRSLWSAADRAARLLNVPDLEPWIVPVAETYYLLAMELGAHEERMAAADSARLAAEARADRAESSRTLPQSAAESVPSRISRLEEERGALQQRVAQLEEQLATTAAQLRETTQELERIKRTIKP